MTKKDEILIKAARIVNDEGIQKLTMSYLAEKAELTKGGVLYHFDSKEDILLNMNKKVIQEFDNRIDTHIRKLSGPYRYSRAYALATLDYINDSENILLTAVFISSHEDSSSKALWEETSNLWDQSFKNDQGDEDKIFELRMICDGIWFTLTYKIGAFYKEKMEKIITNYIQTLEAEVI